MKVLHAAALLTPPPGVLTQMIWEQAAATQEGLDWNVRMYCPRGSAPCSEVTRFSESIETKRRNSFQKLGAWIAFRREYYRWLLGEQNYYDVLLLRYYVHDPFQLSFIRRINRPVFLVHHTLECPELASESGLIGRIRALSEGVIGPPSIRRARGVIAVTPEIGDYETGRACIPSQTSLLFPNGVLYSGRLAEDGRGDVIELLFVASSFVPWHGLDLLLDAMQESSERYILHVVGRVSSMDEVRAKSDSRIMLHGVLDHAAILAVASRCHIGIASLALFRKGMTQACTLKVREYLMLGLPVYAGYNDVFPEHFPFYKNGPCDVASILSFAESLKHVKRREVSDQSRPFIDKARLLKVLFGELFSRVAARV